MSYITALQFLCLILMGANVYQLYQINKLRNEEKRNDK